VGALQSKCPDELFILDRQPKAAIVSAVIVADAVDLLVNARSI
jgi:hypothetical protein